MRISGSLWARDEVQSSPTGVRRCDVRIEHRSRQRDGEGWKAVRLNVRVRVGEALIDQIQSLAIGDDVQIQGYLGQQSHQDPQLIVYAVAVNRMNQEQ